MWPITVAVGVVIGILSGLITIYAFVSDCSVDRDCFVPARVLPNGTMDWRYTDPDGDYERSEYDAEATLTKRGARRSR